MLIFYESNKSAPYNIVSFKNQDIWSKLLSSLLDIRLFVKWELLGSKCSTTTNREGNKAKKKKVMNCPFSSLILGNSALNNSKCCIVGNWTLFQFSWRHFTSHSERLFSSASTASWMRGETSGETEMSPVVYDTAFRSTMTWITKNLHQSSAMSLDYLE